MLTNEQSRPKAAKADKYRQGRDTFSATTDGLVNNGYYLYYMQGMTSPQSIEVGGSFATGIAKGRGWQLQNDVKADCVTGRGYQCTLTVSGSGLFTDRPGREGRKFESEYEMTPDAATEDAARKAYELLDNLTNNQRRGHLPPYNAPPSKKKVQGRRASPSGSSDSYDSDDTSSSSASSACACSGSKRLIEGGYCVRCERKLYHA